MLSVEVRENYKYQPYSFTRTLHDDALVVNAFFAMEALSATSSDWRLIGGTVNSGDVLQLCLRPTRCPTVAVAEPPLRPWWRRGRVWGWGGDGGF